MILVTKPRSISDAHTKFSVEFQFVSIVAIKVLSFLTYSHFHAHVRLYSYTEFYLCLRGLGVAGKSDLINAFFKIST
jgi:hypothetical protein